MTEPFEPKKRRERSPSYPAVSLPVAVDKVRELYQQEKSYLTPIDTILQHWKYSPGSGSGMVAVAAALKFGLLENEGSGRARRAKVSELGLRIVRDTRDESPERDRLLREAALLPQIHRDLWEKYRQALPSDANLKHTLKFEYGFTDLGAAEFAREFRATIAFARLEEGNGEEVADPADYPHQIEHVAPVGGQMFLRGATDNLRVSDAGRAPVGRLPSHGGMVLALPIAGTGPDRWPSLHLPDRLSNADWELMLKVLDAMRPGIVVSEVKTPVETASGAGQAFDATVRVDETAAPEADEPSS